MGDGSIRDRVLVATGSSPQAIEPGRLQGEAWQGYIDARWGEYFAVEVPRASRYLNGVAVPLDLNTQEFYWFPGGLVVRPPDEGSTLYIGTLKYVRDDFNRILDIDVVDERAEAAVFLKNRFGQDADDLVVSLWLRQLPWESAQSQ